MDPAVSGPVPSPSLHRALSLGLILTFSFKNVFTACVETAVLSSILSSALCILPEDIGRAHLFSNLIFVLALYNLAQSVFGLRLSVMQSPSYLLLCSILFYLNSPSNVCPSFGDLVAMGPHRRTLVWQSRLQLLHGCFLMMAAVNVVCSLRAVHSILYRFLSPISLISCVLFIPIALLDIMVEKCVQNVFLSMGTLLLFSIVAYKIPCTFKLKLCDVKCNICSLFAIPITVSIVWTTCFLLTWFDLLPVLSSARTDYHSSMLDYVEYHYKHMFNWGLPKFSLSAASITVPCVFIMIPLSIENYKTVNRIQGKTILVSSNLSRGLYVEALGYLLNVVLGGASGFQFSSESMQDIADTKIWNNSIVQVSSAIIILISMWSTLCVYITLIPEPLLGALLCILCVQQLAACVNMMTTRVDLLRKRNLYIVAMSILIPVILERGFRALSLNSHTSHLFLVVTIATILNHVTSDESSNVQYGEVTPIDPVSPTPPQRQANEDLSECVGSCQDMTCGCLSCFA